MKKRRTESKKHWLSLGAVLLLLAFGAVAVFLSKGSESGSLSTELPAYATANKQVAAAYAYAVQNPGILEKVPCYCGCYAPAPEHGGFEHKNNKNCYLRDDGSWVRHGSECDVCVYITLDVKAGLAKGLSIKQVRDYIDAKYGAAGHAPTRTPPLDEQGNFIRG